MSRRSIVDVLIEHTGSDSPTAAEARKAADEIDGRAERFGKAAVSKQLQADAARMREYASGLDLDAEARKLGVGEPNTKPAKPKAKAKPTGKAKPAGRAKASTRTASTSRRSGRRTSPVVSAVQDVATQGEREAAAQIRSAGDLFWLWLTFALVIGLVAVAVRNPDRIHAGWVGLANVVARFINPWQTANGLGRDSQGRPYQGPPAPTTTTTTTTVRLMRA